MKRHVFVVMFLMGLGNTVFSQNKTTEKVVTEYQVPFFPDQNALGEMELRCIFKDNKKLEQFILKSSFLNGLDVNATHIVTIEEVVIMKGKQRTKKFFRLKEIITEVYPKVVDSIYYQVPCYSTVEKMPKGKYRVNVSCVAGNLSLNDDARNILAALFNEDKVINPGLRFMVTLKEQEPYQEDVTLKKFKLESIIYQVYPNVIEKK